MDTPQRKPARFDLVWVGALVAVALPAAARADYVLPGVMPPMVDPADHTPIPFPSGLVTNQYTGVGLQFPYVGVFPRDIEGSVNTIWSTAAMTYVPTGGAFFGGGIDVWAPAFFEENGIRPPSDAELDYSGSLTV